MFANKDSYVGDFVDGQEHGDGLYTWVDGEVFGGQFVDGKPHGLGVKSWPDGEKYSGDWFEGERSGHGKGPLLEILESQGYQCVVCNTLTMTCPCEMCRCMDWTDWR